MWWYDRAADDDWLTADDDGWKRQTRAVHQLLW